MTNENQLVINNICTVTYYLTRVVKKILLKYWTYFSAVEKIVNTILRIIKLFGLIFRNKKGKNIIKIYIFKNYYKCKKCVFKSGGFGHNQNYY